MSKKVYVILTLVAILTLAVAAVNAAPTFPAQSIYVHVVTMAGEDFADQEIIVMFHNETANCLIAHAEGTTNGTGYIWLTIDLEGNTVPEPQYGTYNVTVIWKAYGRYFLLFNRTGLSAADFKNYFNGTIQTEYYWQLLFRALTDLDQDGVFDDPLYFEDPEDPNRADIAYFEVYFEGEDTPIWTSEANESAWSVKIFNISTVEVSLSLSIPGQPGCYHIDSASNVSLYKEVYWLLDKGSGEQAKVLVGKETIELNASLATPLTFAWANITDLLNDTWKQYDLTVMDGDVFAVGDHYAWLPDSAYTFLLGVDLLTPCGTYLGAIGDWVWPPISVFLQVGDIEIRRATMNIIGLAPGDHPGYEDTVAGSPVYFFWLPNTTYIEGVNMTMNIEMLGIQVFTVSFNTTETMNGNAPIFFSDDVGTYLAWYLGTTDTGNRYSMFYAFISIVEADVIIKDEGPTHQPLQGASVTVIAPKLDPFYTATDYYGRVQLPPFTYIMGGTTTGGEPVIVRNGTIPGWLPVPFQFRTTGQLYNYSFRIYWALPGGSESFLEVTPEDNILSINLTDYIVNGCPTLEEVIFAEVYEVKFRIIDLCEDPITPEDDINAAVILSYTPPGGEEVTFGVGLGEDGIIDIGQVPGGEFKVKLYFKGVTMEPTPDSPQSLVVTKNVWNASDVATFKFPVGDLTIKVTQWDVNEQLLNITVVLELYKNDVLRYTVEGLTDCDGEVTFSKIPLRVTAENEVRVKLYTNEHTPYIRKPQDVDLLVGDYDITDDLAELPLQCNNSVTLPAWIFSFTLKAVDHEGNVLKVFPTDYFAYPVVVALNDTTYGKEFPLEIFCGVEPCACWRNVTVDFMLFNMTGHAGTTYGNGIDEAIFKYTSSQFDSRYPHLFVAGANYSFIVWHGGVVVYNYTFTMPRPSDENFNPTKYVYYFNETTGEITVAETSELNYTWVPEKGGAIAHPILRFTGIKPWTLAGENKYGVTLELVTWTQTLKVFTLSNTGVYLVPYLNLTLIRRDVVNWTIIEGADDVYKAITHVSQFTGNWTNVAWNAVDDDGDGVIVIQVPVWLPLKGAVSQWLTRGTKFGAEIRRAYILAGSEWGSIDVPDTPYNFAYIDSNASGVTIRHNISGYLIGWNYTLSRIEARTYDGNFYPVWYKYYEGVWRVFRVFNKDFLGDNWNMTYWSGAAKVVNTTAMEGFCAYVWGPDFRDNEIPLANQPVMVYVVGETGASEALLDEPKYTGSDGVVTFMPGTAGSVSIPNATKQVIAEPVAYKYHVDVAVTAYNNSVLVYTFETWLNLDDIVEPYGLTTDKVVDKDILSVTLALGEEHNQAEECVELGWDAIKVTVYDWSGKPLKNAMVAAILRSPRAKNIPSVFAFTFENGSAILYVPPGSQAYQLVVFWRDTYLLRFAGKIPREIVIFDTVTDYDTPRTYTPGSGTTLETFVYVGLIRLYNAEGKPLSPEALSKITVEITWPDLVVTEHKPENDGTVRVILNKDTVKSWPFDESSKYSPDSPHPQAPHGDYKVKVTWAGIGVIAEKTFRIHKGRFETPEQTFDINLDVVDVTVTIKTPFDTPMEGATVEITKPDGTKVSAVAGDGGVVSVTEVPPGKLTVAVKKWRDMTVDFTAEVARENAVITVNKIGKLVVKVVGSRGQGLAGAVVDVSGIGTFTTDSGGVVELELVAGSYTVTASKGGRTDSTTVSVSGGATATAELKLDIFMTIAGWELSSGEFAGLLLLVAILVIVLFIIAHEYSAWRKRRIARGIVKPTTTE